MFHVEHLEVASGNFSQKFRFCQFATKIAPYAILPLNTYQLLHLFFKSVFRGGFEGRFFCVFGQKIAAYRFPVRRKRKKITCRTTLRRRAERQCRQACPTVVGLNFSNFWRASIRNPVADSYESPEGIEMDSQSRIFSIWRKSLSR